MITGCLLLWIVIIGVFVWVDKDGRKPNYLMMFLIRGMAAIAHAIIMDILCGVFPEDVYNSSALQLFLYWLPILLFQVTSFWLFFEVGLNWLWNKPIFYYDTVELDSGWIDRLFAKLGQDAHTAAKFAALAVLIVDVIFIYLKY